jgi:YD repeat-containing protein
MKRIAPRKWLIAFGLAVVAAFFLASGVPSAFAVDDHNPIGVTGTFEGMITTGCAYNVLNHNARREIDDVIVPGSIGKYPLKMARYYNSRRTTGYGLMGPGWSHEYLWISSNEKVEHPSGNVWDSHCFGDEGAPLGVSDWPGPALNGHPTFRLADGGTVVFGGTYNSIPIQIIDPYGQTTNISYYPPPNDLLINRVTEPGGRYLQFTYYPSSTLLKQVDAYDGQGHRTDWVVYHYTAIRPAGGGTQGTPMNCLTSVDYSDGQHAYYTYEDDNVPDDPQQGSSKIFPLVSTCNDVRYTGPMRRIAYDYQAQGAHGAILKERYSPDDGVKGAMVSSISNTDPDFPTTFTETRGDSPTRTFTYSDLHLHRFNEDTCPTLTFGPAPQQFLQSYTDFQNHTTQLGYDANWYVNSVTDANNHTTSYTRGPPPNAYPGPKGIGQITRITHPDNTHIDYTYYDEGPNISGHYLQQITDERGNITCHTCDGNHRITRTDHKDSLANIIAFEEFFYNNNNFGLLSTHHLPSNASANGAYVHFQYDSRGLLIAKTNPTTIADWQTAMNTASKTTYTYYQANDPIGGNDWIDRVKAVTLPANAQGPRHPIPTSTTRTQPALMCQGAAWSLRSSMPMGHISHSATTLTGTSSGRRMSCANAHLIRTMSTIGSSPSRTQLVRQQVAQLLIRTSLLTATARRPICTRPVIPTRLQRRLGFRQAMCTTKISVRLPPRLGHPRQALAMITWAIRPR